MSRDALLVGSIPLDTAEEVFRLFGTPLGPSLKAMPDGEVGPRKHWISRSIIRCWPAMPSSRRCNGRSPRTVSNGSIRATPATPGYSRSRMASSRFASAIPAGGSAMRVTRSIPTSCSRRCANKAYSPAPALSGVAAVGEQRAAAADFPTRPTSPKCGRDIPMRSLPRSAPSSTKSRQ